MSDQHDMMGFAPEVKDSTDDMAILGQDLASQDLPYALFHLRKLSDRSSLKKTYRELKDNSGLIVLKPLDGKDYISVLDRMISSSPFYVGHKVRKNAVLADEIILFIQGSEGHGPEQDPDHEQAPGTEEGTFLGVDLARWRERSLGFLESSFHGDLIHAVYHEGHSEKGINMIESGPHIHAVVIPMVAGQLNSFHFFKGKADLAGWHTRYAEHVAELGLRRGRKFDKSPYGLVSRYNKAKESEALTADEVIGKVPMPKKGEDIASYFHRYKRYRDRRDEKILDMALRSVSDRLEAEQEGAHDRTLIVGEQTAYRKVYGELDRLLDASGEDMDRFASRCRQMELLMSGISCCEDADLVSRTTDLLLEVSGGA